MTKLVQLNYDELTTIVKRFKDEGEDYTRLHSNIRQRVHELETEWIGEGAEKFFDEMENKLLPALWRLAEALFFTQTVLLKIMKIFNEKDMEAAGFFKGDFNYFGNFGVGMNSSGIGSMPGQQYPPEDIGANQFDGALPQPGVETAGSGVDSSALPTGELHDPNQEDAGMISDSKNVGVGASGSGGGGSSSQGSMGDLNGMGTGLGSQTPAGVSGTVGGPSVGEQNMPDHVYESTSTISEESGEMNASIAGNQSGENQDSSGVEGAVAAGVVGVAGSAAAGIAAKATRGRKK